MASRRDDEDEDEDVAVEDDDTDSSDANSADDDDEDEEGSSQDVAPSVATPPVAASPDVAGAGRGDDKTKAIQDYIAQKYQSSADNSGVLAAQQAARDANYSANLGSALESLARSNSMAHGGQGVDEGFYQGLRNQGTQGVQLAMANRQANIQDFLRKNDLARQVIQDMMTKGTYDQKQKGWQLQNDFNDPSSQISKNYQAAFAKLFPAETEGMDLSGMSRNELDWYATQSNKKERLTEALKAKEMQTEYLKANMQARQEAAVGRAQEREDQRTQLASYKQEQADKKQSTADENRQRDFQKLLDPTGGRAGEFGRAYAKVAGVERLDGLIKDASTGQIKNLTSAEIEDATIGLANVLTGGSVATDSRVKALVPESAQGNLQKTLQWLTNAPRGTNQQEFVKRISGSLDRERQISRLQLGRIIKSKMNGFEDWAKRNPDGFRHVVNGALEVVGLTANDIGFSGNTGQTAGGGQITAQELADAAQNDKGAAGPGGIPNANAGQVPPTPAQVPPSLPAGQVPPTPAQVPASLPAPHGMRLKQKGKIYQWSGQRYEEMP